MLELNKKQLENVAGGLDCTCGGSMDNNGSPYEVSSDFECANKCCLFPSDTYTIDDHKNTTYISFCGRKSNQDELIDYSKSY